MLTILFLPGAQRLNAIFVVGLAVGQNLLVTPEGLWDGTYVPAFLRRYPFIRGDIEGADPIICVDQDFEGLNEERGEAFFVEDEQTSYLNSQVGLVNAYYEASRRSEEFCELIQRMGLLKSVTIDVKSQRGQPRCTACSPWTRTSSMRCRPRNSTSCARPATCRRSMRSSSAWAPSAG